MVAVGTGDTVAVVGVVVVDCGDDDIGFASDGVGVGAAVDDDDADH